MGMALKNPKQIPSGFQLGEVMIAWNWKGLPSVVREPNWGSWGRHLGFENTSYLLFVCIYIYVGINSSQQKKMQFV